MNTRSDGGPITALRFVAVGVILAGAFGLVHSQITLTEERTAAAAGPVSMMVRTDHQVTVPVWVGVAGIVTGLVMLVGTGRVVRA